MVEIKDIEMNYYINNGYLAVNDEYEDKDGTFIIIQIKEIRVGVNGNPEVRAVVARVG